MSETTLFLALAGLIGLFVGLLVASLFSGKESRKPKVKLPPADMIKQGYADEARLWYSPAGKKLAVEMDGEYYRDIEALTPEQRKKAQKLAGLFQTWAVLPQMAAAPVMPVEPEPVKKSPFAYEEPIDSPKVEPARDEEDFLGNLQSVIEEPQESPFTTTVTPEKEAARPLTITEQISEILDELIEKSGLKGQNIKLMENPGHGVDVYVGLEKFAGVDDVPYPQVRELIKTAVKLWEKEAEAYQRAQQKQ